MNKAPEIAIIGAGAAGLVAAKELLAEGLTVRVFEQQSHVGGIWQYQPQVEDDLLGLKPRHRVQSSVYESLHTNLPRDLMAFLDFPFDNQGGGDDAWPRYPHHTQVLQYLDNFCQTFQLINYIQFDTFVEAINPAGTGWNVTAVKEHTETTEYFDAVVVCNGHYSEPKLAQVPDMDVFTGQLMHSHNYRTAEPFAGRRIAILGTAASGFDLALELGRVASQVYWLGHQNLSQSLPLPNVINAGMPQQFEPNGLLLEGGARIENIDVFIYATGYRYHLPFLEKVIPVDNNRVGPLYYDIIPSDHMNLGFIGLPYLVIPFPLFQIQARWFAKLLAGKIEKPSAEQMSEWLSVDLKRKSNQPVRHHHRLAEKQIPYMNQLLSDMGADPLPGWFSKLAQLSQENRQADPVNFRLRPLPNIAPTRVVSPDP